MKTELVSPPGEKFNYSNDGYNLLAAIVEIVSGMKGAFATARVAPLPRF